MKLSEDTKRAWRLFSVQAMAVTAAANGAWLAVPEDMRASVPEEWLQVAAIVLCVLGIVGRLVEKK